MSGSATAGIDRSLSEAQFSADAMCRLRLLGAGAANWRFVPLSGHLFIKNAARSVNGGFGEAAMQRELTQ
jgi:hypothetical protein